MNWLPFVAGILLFTLTLSDLGVTALSTRGAGYLTEFISKYVWKIFLKMSGNDGSKSFLEFCGMATIALLLLTWILMIWISNTLIYSAVPNSIIHSASLTPADFWEKMYTVGYVLSSMGLGDYVMPADEWKVYTAFISFTGIIFLTISVTYLIPILSAEIEKKTLSIYISSYGNSVDDLLLKSYNGKNFDRFDDLINQLEQPIIAHGQKHLTYPILNYFHNCDRSKSFVLNLTILDEALYILLYHIDASIRPDKERLMRLRIAIDSFLATLKDSFIQPAKDPLPEPDYQDLCDKGIPCSLKPLDISIESEDQLAKRRKILKSLIEFHGWKSDHLYTNKPQI